MGQERLSSLALMNIHYEKNVNFNSVIDKFKLKGNRRIQLYSRTSVQRNSLSRTSRLAGRWLDWTSGCRGQKYCIVSRKLTFNLYFS